MGKFCQISTELLPFFVKKIGFCALSCTFFDRLSSNFVYELIFRRCGLGL